MTAWFSSSVPPSPCCCIAFQTGSASRTLTAAERSGLHLVVDSDAISQVRLEIVRVADLDVPVLLRGETGTGKELVASAVHEASRRSGPFLAVSLGAVPASLASSELFGAAQGAFTGAGRGQTGYFERAGGGTLLLDEIGEASTEVQVMLLRALENGEIQPVGAREPRPVNVRVIAATDAHLEAEGRGGEVSWPAPPPPGWLRNLPAALVPSARRYRASATPFPAPRARRPG